MKQENHVLMGRMSQYFIICIAYTQNEWTELMQAFCPGCEFCVRSKETNVSNSQSPYLGVGGLFKNIRCFVINMY